MVSRPRSRAPIIAGLCVAAALLSGCSAVRLAYNQSPTLAYWWLDGYADFNDAQTPRVRAAIDEWLAWHRRTQLIDYVALLRQGEAEVLLEATPERACEWWSDVSRRVNTLVEHTVPTAADIALSLTPAQIDHIEQRYVKRNAEFRDDYLQPDPAERLQASVDRAIERAETLYGKLDAAQRKNVARLVAASPFDADVWFSERRQRQQDALQMLRKLRADDASREQAQAAMRSYLGQVIHSPREGYRRYADSLVRYNCEFSARLHNGTTDAQRRVALQKLKGWEADLRALVGDGAM